MHLICSNHEELKSFAKAQNISYEAITLERQPSLWQDIRSLFKICAYIKKHKIDTVVGHQPKGCLMTVIAGRLMGVKEIIIFSHGLVHEGSTGIKRRILIWEAIFEARLAHKVICVSNSVAQVRRDACIDRPEQQYILHKGTCGGIDTKIMFNPKNIDHSKLKELSLALEICEDDFVIGFCGRMVRDKGIVELVDGFKALVSSNPTKKLKLLIIGSPEKRDSISSALFEYMNQNPNIIFTGHIEREKLSYYYTMMDVFVLPSYREGFGMVTIEAGAMEVPAIVSESTGCIDSIIEHQTGIYCDITANSIQAQIEYLFDDSTRLALGKNARSWICENFDHDILYPALLDVYKKKN